jgi:ATP-dependent DNA helicase RecG
MPQPSAPAREKSGPARALEKLGLKRDIDLALHLPLRWEDQTRLVPMRRLEGGAPAQVQGVVVESRIDERPRRQLVTRLRDDTGELLLRFLHFHPAQQKALAVGTLVRAVGEVRGGFFGREMVHPQVKAVQPDTPLPDRLTPIYPAPRRCHRPTCARWWPRRCNARRSRRSCRRRWCPAICRP